MPRKAKKIGAEKRLKTRLYRAHLSATGRPEASAVDISVAAAVAAYVSKVARDPSGDSDLLRRLLRDASDRLVGRGYDAKQVRAVVFRRMRRFQFAEQAE